MNLTKKNQLNSKKKLKKNYLNKIERQNVTIVGDNFAASKVLEAEKGHVRLKIESNKQVLRIPRRY